MAKLAHLITALGALHPEPAPAASLDQTHTNLTGVNPMTKILSLTAAFILFVPVAAVFLMQASRMIA